MDEVTAQHLDNICSAMIDTGIDQGHRMVFEFAANLLIRLQEHAYMAQLEASARLLDERVSQLQALRLELGAAQIEIAKLQNYDEDYVQDKREADLLIEDYQGKVRSLSGQVEELTKANEQLQQNIVDLVAANHRLQEAKKVETPAPPKKERKVVVKKVKEPKQRESSGNRYKMTDAELKDTVVALIKTLAAELGHTPTVAEFEPAALKAGLPTFKGLTYRIPRTWTQLCLDAGLTPNKPRKESSDETLPAAAL